MMHIPYLCSALASRQQDPELTCFVRTQGMTKSNTDKIMSLLLTGNFLPMQEDGNLLSKESLVALKLLK